MKGLSQKHSALYAVARQEKVKEFLYASPEQARLVPTALKKTLQNIDDTFPKIASGDLDWRDLKPIHEQFRNAQTASASGINWSLPLNKWIVGDILSDYEAEDFSICLQSSRSSTLVIAELATFGTATFFIAGCRCRSDRSASWYEPGSIT